MSKVRRITAYVCEECVYWRQDRLGGLHQTTDPKDPNGRLIVHELREAVFVEESRAGEREDATAHGTSD